MADPRTDAESALRAGDPRGALQHLTAAVRAKPADAPLRIFIAQLLCVLGQWERAHTQLNVLADLDASAAPMRETVGHSLQLMQMYRAPSTRARRLRAQPRQKVSHWSADRESFCIRRRRCPLCWPP